MDIFKMFSIYGTIHIVSIRNSYFRRKRSTPVENKFVHYLTSLAKYKYLYAASIISSTDLLD